MEKYFILPWGNPTMLVNNLQSAIPRDIYVPISKKIMTEESRCEQVGFIEKTKNWFLRCQMMWWEFCVNALRSLAYWNYQNTWKTNTVLESSGTEKTFQTQVTTWVGIQLEKKFEKIELSQYLTLIKLEGIAHFVLRIEDKQWDENEYRIIFQELQQKYNEHIKNFWAIWLIAINQNNEIFPLVYVVETNTFIYESACGSGTLAVFIVWTRMQDSFLQPSWNIYVVSEKKDFFTLNGTVSDIEF